MKRNGYIAAALLMATGAAFAQERAEQKIEPGTETSGVVSIDTIVVQRAVVVKAVEKEPVVLADGFVSETVTADTPLNAEGFISEAKGLNTLVVPELTRLTAAVYDVDGKLKRPENLDRWVFLSTTLGMTYMGTPMDPEDPGHFSTVMIEPDAYEHFLKTGSFGDGTIFAKIIHQSKLGHGGVSMGENIYLEVHVKDKQRYPQSGSGFYAWAPGDADFAEAFPDDMGCLACHQEQAAYQDVFTQFYPVIRAQAVAAKATREK